MRRTWTPTVALLDDDTVPLFARIATAITEDVRRGRLRPGDTLPGSRPLAATLGVHRNTVLAAYEALRAEGWVETSAASATRVATALPIRAPRRFDARAPVREGLPESPPYALGKAPPARAWGLPSGVIALYGGMPDVGIFPAHLLARAYRAALGRGRHALLDYGDPRGVPALRRALAEMLSSLRGVAAREDNVLVTRGSQQGIDLLARTLLGPGEVIAVEAMGYAPAWESFRATGAELVPLALDAQGVDVDALEALCARRTVRALYVTPHHQYPTGVTLASARRLALLGLAKRHRVCVIEDDYDHEFHYEGRPVLPLASADPDGVVAYVGSLSKLLAPGLRTGFVVGPVSLIEHLAARRSYVDRQGDHVTEAALATLLEEGEVARHAGRARRAYQARRDAFVEALGEYVGERLRYEVPRGGMALWAGVEGARGADALIDRAREAGVYLQRTRGMCFDGRDRPAVRLGFAGHEPEVLREAARRLGRCFRAAR